MTADRDTLLALGDHYDRCGDRRCARCAGDAPEWFKALHWTPKVGDRVRVVLNGECPVRPDPDAPASFSGGTHNTGYSSGWLGTVQSVDRWGRPSREGHPYLVQWDTPQPAPRNCPDQRPVGADYYAACELELLTDGDGPLSDRCAGGASDARS